MITNGLPKLENVFLVEGLFTNLISITQLCDQGMEANFDRFGCKITDQEGEVLMRGIRTKNNCYKWIAELEAQTDMLNTILEHQKSLSLPQLGNKDERRRVSKSSSTLKSNQINNQLHSVKNSGEISALTKDILIYKYTEILDLEKYEKLRDRLDISPRKKL